MRGSDTPSPTGFASPGVTERQTVDPHLDPRPELTVPHIAKPRREGLGLADYAHNSNVSFGRQNVKGRFAVRNCFVPSLPFIPRVIAPAGAPRLCEAAEIATMSKGGRPCRARMISPTASMSRKRPTRA